MPGPADKDTEEGSRRTRGRTAESEEAQEAGSEIITLANGDTYQGDMRKGRPHGKGEKMHDQIESVGRVRLPKTHPLHMQACTRGRTDRPTAGIGSRG